MTETVSVPINEEPIRLSQFLKLANVVQDGLEAKIVIIEGEVLVNNEPENRRGRKLFAGDKVRFAGTVFVVQKR